MTQFSSRGVDFLIELEGLKLKAYKDSADKWTIGVGHLIRQGEQELKYTTITKLEAIDLLHHDLRPAEQVVNRLVKVPITQYQYDALVIFTFNVGTESFADSTVLKMINQCNYKDACAHLDDWVKVTKNGKKTFSQGLQNRRDEEQELFDHADYTKQR
jgi:lysozyme